MSRKMNLWQRSNLDFLAKLSAIAFVFFLPISTALTDIFFVSSIVLTLFAGNLREKWRLIFGTRVIAVCLLLFFLILIGVFYSSGNWLVRLDVLKKYSTLLLGVFLLPLFIEKKWRYYAIVAFICAIFLISILSYLKFFYGIVLHCERDKNFGIFKSHIDTNFFMAFASYLVAIFFIDYPKFRWWLILLLMMFVINTIFIGDGRTGYWVFIFLVILFFAQNFKLKKIIFAFLFLLSLFLSAYHLSPIFKQSIDISLDNFKLYLAGRHATSISAHDVTSMGLRLEFYQNSLRLIKRHPLFGTGTGSFYHQYSLLRPLPKTKVITSDPTNEYLNISVQLGLVGLSVMLWLFYLFWRDSFILPDLMQKIAQGCIVGFASGCLVNSWLMSTAESHFFVYFTALLFASLYDPSIKRAVIVRKSLLQAVYCQRSMWSTDMARLFNNPDQAFSSQAYYFKNQLGDTTTVVQISLAGRHFVIKRYNFRSFWHALKLRFRSSYALRSWVNAKYLLNCGIATVKPVAVIEERIGPLYGRSYFISEYQEGVRGNDYFASKSSNWSVACPALAKLMRQLRAAKVVHHDLRPGNILMVKDHPFLMDLDHMRQYRKRSKRFQRHFQLDVEHFLFYVKRDYLSLYLSEFKHCKV